MTEHAARIYKLEDKNVWDRALADGMYQGAPIDLADGFIHFSTADQVRETAAKHFPRRENLMLVAVDTATLGLALKWEPSRGGALFPHLYAALDPRTATEVIALPLDAHGRHIFPKDIA